MSPLHRLFVLAFWAAVIFAYVSAVLPAAEAPHISMWDKLNHMAAFFTITFLARAAYPRLAVLPLFALLAGFGAFIELSQAVPFIHRDAEWDDWFADIVAILVGLVLAWPFAVLANRRRARRASAAQEAPPALDP
ncbi:teicoplanin resistance protein VanZ [Sphingomonas crusticola]|uniref:teicoplanin resistance protein VanZ n=1 Tax=Sphingomonas crusticola TaxID=1697973 RepID=UPI00196731A5|nr:teicoplanin resistance protein VanZ [Sphingomonas crusticola]